MAHIKFSTDSASDIPAALREEWNIQVLPFPIAMGDREYMDGFDFTPDEFFRMLLAAPQIPTHAQLTAYFFTECFEQAWKEGYTDLIHTSINSKGSATYGIPYRPGTSSMRTTPMPRTPSISISSTPTLHHVLRLRGGGGRQDGCCRGPGGRDRGFYPGLGRSGAGDVRPS